MSLGTTSSTVTITCLLAPAIIVSSARGPKISIFPSSSALLAWRIKLSIVKDGTILYERIIQEEDIRIEMRETLGTNVALHYAKYDQ